MDHKIKLLTVREEYELFRRFKRGNGEARKRLIECNIPLVVSIAKDFISYSHHLEELNSVGQLALIRCIDNFDITKRCRISTYAYQRISRYIKNYLRKHNRPVDYYKLLSNTPEVKPDYGVDFPQVLKELETLPERTQVIIKHFFGLPGFEKKTFAECGQMFNLSAERARRLCKAALETLRKKLDDS